MPTPDHIEATGNALSRFGVIELIILGVIGVMIVVILFLGKRLIDVWMTKINNGSQETIAKLNNENQQINNETNSFVKEIAKSRDTFEEAIRSQNQRIEKLESGYQSIGKIEKMLQDDVVDRKKRQASLDKELGGIKSDIKDVFSILADHEELWEKTSEGTLTNMLFNENPKLSVFLKLKSYLRLIGLKKNGDIKERGFDLILQNKPTWKTVLQVMPSMKLMIVDEVFFKNTLEEINHRIFDGMMW
jgi:cell division protein FtsB